MALGAMAVQGLAPLIPAPRSSLSSTALFEDSARAGRRSRGLPRRERRTLTAEFRGQLRLHASATSIPDPVVAVGASANSRTVPPRASTPQGPVAAFATSSGAQPGLASSTAQAPSSASSGQSNGSASSSQSNGSAAPATQETAAPPPPPAPLRTLFPPLSSHRQGWLQVSRVHKIYFEVFGNPKGQPAVFLHGGPGAGCWPKHAQFFDPQHYRIVLLDQRACGKSTPRGSLDDNTTQALIADLEQLREHLKIDRWLVLGGSWGATLALLYAQAHRARVSGVVLRGLCLMRRRDISWVYRKGGGLDSLIPQAWGEFSRQLAPEELEDAVAAYHSRLTSQDAATREKAASAWLRLEMAAMFAGSPSGQGAQGVYAWDGKQYLWNGAPLNQNPQGASANVAPSTSAPSPSPSTPAPEGQSPAQAPNGAQAGSTQSKQSTQSTQPAQSTQSTQTTQSTQPAQSTQSSTPSSSPSWSSTVVQSRLECHYAHNGAFIWENQILEEVEVIRSIPTRVVHGRWDLVCPVKNAFDLHEVWPEAELRIVSNAGHSMYDAGITHELVQATEDFKSLS